MNARLALIPPDTCRWLASPEGRKQLQDRTTAAANAFIEPNLQQRLDTEWQAAVAGGGQRMRMGNSLRLFSEELAVLALAHAHGVRIPAGAWQGATTVYLPALYAIDELSFQGRNATPPWRADLWTADIAANLACALHWSSPLDTEAEKLAETIRTKCVRPIFADWLDDATRIHSLDTMGHNWWSVVVAGAGVACALLGDEKGAARAAEKLGEWFRFKGNEFSRKRPNFGPEGDFVEGFHYAEYALAGVCVFAQAYPVFRLVPDGLGEAQAAGLAAWLRRSFLRPRDGWRVQRFSDINPRHRPRVEVWHTLARATGDRQLLALAHELKPVADKFPEFLLWEPRPAERVERPERDALRLYPTSGLAFDTGRHLSLTVRAGEFWNHNHLDAGTFILCQDEVVWLDDAGTCGYGHPDYLDYFIAPEAHNVAFAPALRPPLRHAFREGMAATGRYISGQCCGAVNVICVDTGILSGNALSRSYRWFFRLGDAGVLIWDDLSAYQPHEFVSILNTACRVQTGRPGGDVGLRSGGTEFGISFFADAGAELTFGPVKRGADPTAPDLALQEERTCLTWRTNAVERVKLGLALGTRLRNARWSGSFETGGWTCETEADGGRWRVWFNPAMDGRNTHLPCTGRWGEFETDAYALLVSERDGKREVTAVEASFVRISGKVIFAHLARQPLVAVPCDQP